LMFELTFLPSLRVAIDIKMRSVRASVAACGYLPWLWLRVA